VNPVGTEERRRSVTTRDGGAGAERTFCAAAASASVVLSGVEVDAVVAAGAEASVELPARTT
jgi:hypothetical protein